MKDNNIFKEINSRANIVDLARAYGLQVDRQDRCTCFLHSDKEPSLQIHKDTNTWWCYVCGEGYTPIDFVVKKTGVTALEAAKEINKMLNLGINIDGEYMEIQNDLEFEVIPSSLKVIVK